MDCRSAAAMITGARRRGMTVAALLAVCAAGAALWAPAGRADVLTPAPAPGAAKPRPHSRAHTPLGGAKSPVKLPRDFDGDVAEGRIVNLTPYTWTLVADGFYPNPRCGACDPWASSFPATLKPGQDFVYRLRPWMSAATTRRYDGWFTYRADALHHAEYLSLNLVGSHCWGVCLPTDGPALVPQVLNATSPPRVVSDAGPTDFGAITSDPEVGWTGGGEQSTWPGINPAFDFTFQTKGDYTIDAAKAPPRLADLLNALCSGVSGTSCSFTQTGDIHWGIGALDQQTSAKSCPLQPTKRSSRPTGVRRSAPPADSPDWHEVTVEAKRTRSVSVGGSLTASTEVKLLGLIDSEVSVKIGAEHEWGDTRTFEKSTRIEVPRGELAGVWVAPVVGKVTGTLVVSTQLARYTISNFEETASGVSKDLTTPAFDIITYARPMTPEEVTKLCAS